jgi:hypothetical protein
MIDSGTTFTYLPQNLYDQITAHFSYFCQETGTCGGEVIDNCFGYDERKY